MFKRKILGSGIVAAAALIPSVALAHTGHGAASGFLHGFQHPTGGLDHVLAMVLVGLLAFQMGGRALYLIPLSFVSVMAAGGVLGIAGIGMPFVEAGIALSIVVLGLAVALRAHAPVLAAMAVTGLFAIFHGHAHGAEMPADANGLAYGAGFILATALLHAAGMGFAGSLSCFGEAQSRRAIRAAGAAATAIGLAILTGAV